MYERFTDRARKALHLANLEAQRFCHEYIGTEHILIGLIKEGSGVAANVLKNLDISLPKVLARIEAIVLPGPDMVKMRKLPQTPRVTRALEFAIEEARGMNHNYIGSEHLLLGLLREKDGVAGQVLVEFGVKLDEVRQEILNLLGQAKGEGQRQWNSPAVGPVTEPTDDDYARLVERIKGICGSTLPAKEAFERIVLAVKVFNESEPPDADPPLEFDV